MGRTMTESNYRRLQRNLKDDVMELMDNNGLRDKEAEDAIVNILTDVWMKTKGVDEVVND